MAKGRVLIVDDEPTVAESLRDMLASWGYETEAESDGMAGLERIEKFRPSVIITDVIMPRLDGFGLLLQDFLGQILLDVTVASGKGPNEASDVAGPF